MPSFQESVGSKIRTLRKAKGWRQEELAEHSGLHSTYIGQLERGERNATIESYLKVAGAFNISAAELFTSAPHKLEKQFNAPAEDIMEAILHGFRAQVDVKGKLAELYLSRFLKQLELAGTIQNVTWHDEDGKPDFEIMYNNKQYIIECKNVRSGKEGKYAREDAYKVEVQKTRNSKDGSNTRSYKVNHFQILAACLFNQIGKWEFVFTISKYLKKKRDDNSFLEIFQPVPCKTCHPWTEDFKVVLRDVAGEKVFEPQYQPAKQ